MRIWMLAALLAAPIFGQGQAIDEVQGSITYGKRTIKRGQARGPALRGLRTIPQGAAVLVIPFGATVLFDARDRVSEIVLRHPFKGKTQTGIGLGDTGEQLRRIYPGVSNATGTVQLNGFSVSFSGNGKIVAIAVNGKSGTPPARPSQPRPPRPAPGGGNQGTPLTTKTVIWDETWRATPRPVWKVAPGNAWPTQRGKLLVRVAYGPDVHRVDQLHAGVLRANTPADDLPTPSDFIAEAIRERGGQGRTWRWAAIGTGMIRVQIIWFPTERALRRHVRGLSFPQFLASVVHPGRPELLDPNGGVDYDALSPRVSLIWEQSWDLTAPSGWNWVRGPHRNWARDGSLLVRAWGSHFVRDLAYRVGNRGNLKRIDLGDHILETGILPRAENNPFGILFGSPARRYLHFAARGQGRIHVQVYWIPHRAIAPRWCTEHPLPPIVLPGDPGFGGTLGGTVADPRRAPGYVTVTFTGQITHADTGAPLPNLDVIVQQQDLPRAIYGGIRTDANGVFNVDASIPTGTHVVLRLPSHDHESNGQAFRDEGRTMIWTHRLR